MNSSAAINDAWSSLPLEAELCREPYRFEFFQAVRILERLLHHSVGMDGHPEDEVIRFRAHQSLLFPPSEIHDIALEQEGRHRAITVTFMGLTGPSGALPRHYTELVINRLRQKDRTLSDFLDLFNHRLIALFYRAWQKNRFWIGYERANLVRERYRDDPAQYRAFVTEVRPHWDRFSQCLLDVIGMGTPALRYRASVRTELRSRTTVADQSLRFYAGLFAQQHRSAAGLEGLLQDFFNVDMRVVQFLGQWLMLDESNQTQVVEGGNTLLGKTAVVGERFWDMQGKFRIRIGPMTYAEFQDFLPSGTAYRKLADLARLYAGLTFDIEAQLVLMAEEIPRCHLSTEASPRLGWNTWIHAGAPARDADDSVLALESVEAMPAVPH